MVLLWTTPPEFAEVDLVGSEDEVELVEIRGVYLAGAERRQVISSLAGMPHRTRVGRVADMVTLGPGRSKLDVEAGLLGLSAKDDLHRRRTANVAHTDEQDSSRAPGHLLTE